jgi:Acetoacetate decarboxylase (ADC)
MRDGTNGMRKDAKWRVALLWCASPGEEGAPPEVCELVLTPVNFELIAGADGRGEGFSGPGNVTFDSSSVVDSWSRLSVRRMVSGSWGYYNMVLPYGKVIKRYRGYEPAFSDQEGVPQPVKLETVGERYRP